MSRCPDCGVAPGQEHLSGCDVERCVECGFQKIGCDCQTQKHTRWTGMWPGDLECREFGLLIAGEPDLNRLMMAACGRVGGLAIRWDRERERWVRE